MKDKLVAALLALFVGGLGIHRFYLGQTVLGIIYLLFFWTMIPAIVALIDAIVWLVMSEEKFNAKYNEGRTTQIPEMHNMQMLAELNNLRVSGAITEEEYQEQKAKYVL
jgi:TM2 domain-containing membrane protein YozV